MLKQLKRKKSEYKISINQLLKRRNSVRDTLKELNIVKLRQKEEAERRKKEEKQRKKIEERDMDDEKELPDVKSYASTYHAVKTIRYRGKKTIAPLRKYVVTKQYGPYVDPVYNIKIFNESITMEAKGSDKRVRNVFNGKVVLAKATPMLDNIVIVEHKNGLHTIYAHLSEIAPHIRKGKKVKKGAIIGKIAKELLFEVTQKNAHINPVTLIN
jgi:murein DD-endopeptidase MepM/ murein hydrolase activator NlpD